MEADTLIQTLIGVGVASLTSIFKTRGQSSSCSVVASRNYSVIIIHYYCTYWTFHAVRSSTGDISYFHEILIPRWTKWFNYSLNFIVYLLFKELDILFIYQSQFDKLETLVIVITIKFIIFFYKLFKAVGCVLYFALSDEVCISFPSCNLH